MKALKRVAKRQQRRTYRVRNRVRSSAKGRLRLSVHRTNKHIYAQVIDDVAGHTICSASSLDKEVAGPGKAAGNKEAATLVGKLLAKRATEKDVKEVVFDRGSCRYHGRIAALADAAREGGLEF